MRGPAFNTCEKFACVVICFILTNINLFTQKILNEISHSGLFFYANLLSVRKCNKIVLFADSQACARTKIKKNVIYFSLTISVSNTYKIICLFILHYENNAQTVITSYQSKT